MCRQPLSRTVHCAPKESPCPHCGTKGRRVRRLPRRLRSLEYQRPAWLVVHYAEYRARCACGKSFRSWPRDLPQKADHDQRVRQAVLDRLLDDGLNVERTRACLKRDSLLHVSAGFIDDCLDHALRRLNCPEHRRRTREGFSGTPCVDELHLGRFTLLLATGPLPDASVGFALVRVNDQPHLRRFLLMLRHWGFLPRVVVSGGSDLYPSVLAEGWPHALHQLGVSHVIRDLNDQVLDAARRLRGAAARGGQAGGKPRPGRRRKGQKRPRRQRPTSKEKATFVFRHRYLTVKRRENLSKQEQKDLQQSFAYLAELRTPWEFCRQVYALWETRQNRRLARWRWSRLPNRADFQEVPGRGAVLAWLEGNKYTGTQAYLEQPPRLRVKTNNHVERANRRLRFDEKVRYKWRSRQSVVRFALLKISRDQPQPKPALGPNNGPGVAAGTAGQEG